MGCCQRTRASTATTVPDVQVHDRLVVQDELAGVLTQRKAEVRLESPHERRLHLRGVRRQDHVAGTEALGLLQGRISGPKQVIDTLAGAAQRHSCPRVDAHDHVCQLERLVQGGEQSLAQGDTIR